MDDREPQTAPPGRGERKTPAIAVVLLALLTLAGLGVRLKGTGFGLPHMREKDYDMVVQVSHLRGDEKVLKSKGNRVLYASYPMMTALCTWIACSPPPLELPPDATLEDHMRRAGDDFVDTRRTVAFLSVLVIPATWLLARRFVGPWWALWAAAAIGTSLLHTFFSQQARPHGPASAQFVLTMLALFRLRRRPTTASYALVGLALAVLVGILQSGIAMGIPLLAAHLMRDQRRLFDPRLLLPGLILAASMVGTYWPMIDPSIADTGSSVDEAGVVMPGHIVEWHRFNGNGLGTTLGTLRSYEPVLSVLVILALLVLLASRFDSRAKGAPDPERRQRRQEVLIALAFVIPYGFMISLWEENYERFVIPLLPFLACFVAWAGRELSARAPGALGRAVLPVMLLSLFLPGYASARLAWIRSTPDTASRAAAWVEEHVDPVADRVFITPWWDLPLIRTEETLHEKIGSKVFHIISPWKLYQAEHEPGELPGQRWRVTTMVVSKNYDGRTVEGLRGFLDYFGPGYYVVDAKKRGHPWMKWMTEELAARGELLQRISPDKDEWAWNYALFDQDGVESDWPDFLPRVLKARSVGPVIEIYRVD